MTWFLYFPYQLTYSISNHIKSNTNMSSLLKSSNSPVTFLSIIAPSRSCGKEITDISKLKTLMMSKLDSTKSLSKKKKCPISPPLSSTLTKNNFQPRNQNLSLTCISINLLKNWPAASSIPDAFLTLWTLEIVAQKWLKPIWILALIS